MHVEQITAPVLPGTLASVTVRLNSVIFGGSWWLVKDPGDWKKANWRQLSLTSVPRKIMEQIIVGPTHRCLKKKKVKGNGMWLLRTNHTWHISSLRWLTFWTRAQQLVLNHKGSFEQDLPQCSYSQTGGIYLKKLTVKLVQNLPDQQSPRAVLSSPKSIWLEPVMLSRSCHHGQYCLMSSLAAWTRG